VRNSFGFSIQIPSQKSTRLNRPNSGIDIKNYYKNKNCIVCGSGHMIEIDHKNYLYNDFRLNDIKKQTFDDFQSLCKLGMERFNRSLKND
jgi:hypothetical protein